MLSGWSDDLRLICVFFFLKKVLSVLAKGLFGFVNLVLPISIIFLEERAEKKKGSIVQWHLPPGVHHILSLSCKLKNVSVYNTHESPFQKLSLHSALKLCEYLAFFIVGPKTLKIFCIKLLWGWCLVSLWDL